MRFHVISLPHTQTTQDFSACAFTEKVRKFCIMMKNQGHEVFLYAGDKNEAPCDELVTCITEDERQAVVGDKHYIHASFDYKLPHWTKFNQNVIDGLKTRLEQKDFICVIGGLAHKQIADAYPENMTVEFGIGYGGTFAPYRVFESYAWMHTVYGANQPHHNPNAIDGIWFDDVIPSYFELEKFPFQEEKEDYYLYIGRLTDRKGYKIAEEVCKKLGKRLILAGEGDTPTYGEHVGVVGPERRAELMGRAKAVFVPTVYIEPFGSVAVEAQLCGTPVISTDWGAFVETVVDGVTGYRCRTFNDFIRAANSVDSFDYKKIRETAEKYSLENVGRMYQIYFERLLTLWEDGWYNLR